MIDLYIVKMKHHGYKNLDDIYHTVTNYEESHGKVKHF